MAHVGEFSRLEDNTHVGKSSSVVPYVSFTASPIYIIATHGPIYAAGPDMIGVARLVHRVEWWRTTSSFIAAEADDVHTANLRRHIDYVADWLARNQDTVSYLPSDSTRPERPGSGNGRPAVRPDPRA